MKQEAMSKDGYIVDQDFTDDMPYGKYPSSFNGCGWIAVYNFLHAQGRPEKPEEVYREVLSILPYNGGRGTPFKTLVLYLAKKNIPFRTAEGKKRASAGIEKRFLRDPPVCGGAGAALCCVCPHRQRTFPLF